MPLLSTLAPISYKQLTFRLSLKGTYYVDCMRSIICLENTLMNNMISRQYVRNSKSSRKIFRIVSKITGTVVLV